MKPNQQPEDDESLSQALSQWAVTTPLPPRFQEQVWKRIARAEAEPQATLWAGLRRLIEVALPRPKFALSYVAILLLLGVAGGALAAQIKTSHLDAALSARYVQSVTPYQAGVSQP